MESSREHDDFASLLGKIEREHSVPCLGYKDRCIRRRIGVRMRATGVHTFAEYEAVLDSKPGEWEKLLAALTINVTKFFRDPGAFRALEEQAYPLLRAHFPDMVDVWSAGCSHGHEPYSLAMGLSDAVGAEHFRIEATDIDADSLAAAREARYSASVLTDVSDDRRQRYIEPGDPGQVIAPLRARVNVVRHDLLRDSVAPERFHLITCRNVIIYFSREAQATLFEKLYDALVPGGILMMGKVETLIGPARDKFTTLNLRERLFRRPLA
ncbi:MAG: CheR family methyltransferase [Gemmatimonas sp.]